MLSLRGKLPLEMANLTYLRIFLVYILFVFLCVLIVESQNNFYRLIYKLWNGNTLIIIKKRSIFDAAKPNK